MKLVWAVGGIILTAIIWAWATDFYESRKKQAAATVVAPAGAGPAPAL